MFGLEAEYAAVFFGDPTTAKDDAVALFVTSTIAAKTTRGKNGSAVAREGDFSKDYSVWFGLCDGADRYSEWFIFVVFSRGAT